MIENLIPKGWRFYRAENIYVGSCTIVLCRDPKARIKWLRMSEEEQKENPMYIFGRGVNFEAALKDAIGNIP